MNQSIAETVNELIAELIGLNSANPSSDISAEIIVNTINELIVELIDLSGIESNPSDADLAEVMKIIRNKETVQELMTEIISLKRNRIDAEASTVADTDTNLDVIALTIALIIAETFVGTRHGQSTQGRGRTQVAWAANPGPVGTVDEAKTCNTAGTIQLNTANLSYKHHDKTKSFTGASLEQIAQKVANPHVTEEQLVSI